MISRRTIGKPVEVSGVGLHTGQEVTVVFCPARRPGVRFARIDLPYAPEFLPADATVDPAGRRTLLQGEGAGISTVEHVMAAVAGLAIDDLRIELNGPEPPAMDGSARAFAECLNSAGIRENNRPTRVFTVNNPFDLRVGDSRYAVFPSDELKIRVEIEWDHPVIGRQNFESTIDPPTFMSQLAGARTFGFLYEEKELRESGLIKGVSAENAIVLDHEKVVEGGLRWPDEFARHKALDLIGDLGLLGGRLLCEIHAIKPSHRGNLAVTDKIKQEADSSTVLDVHDIMKVLPHRYPMLLVDRIIEFEEEKRIVGIKNVTINEPFFQGHFPGHPIMPGVLVIEAMAQAGGMLMMNSVENPEEKVVYFMSLDNVKFRKPVVPGDQLRFELELVKFRGKTCQMKGVALVEGKKVAEAEMMAAIMDR